MIIDLPNFVKWIGGSTGLASWVQAVGSIAAIIATAMITRHGTRESRRIAWLPYREHMVKMVAILRRWEEIACLPLADVPNEVFRIAGYWSFLRAPGLRKRYALRNPDHAVYLAAAQIRNEAKHWAEDQLPSMTFADPYTQAEIGIFLSELEIACQSIFRPVRNVSIDDVSLIHGPDLLVGHDSANPVALQVRLQALHEDRQRLLALIHPMREMCDRQLKFMV